MQEQNNNLHVDYLVNRHFAIREPTDKKRLPEGYHSHNNYSPVKGTAQEMLSDYLKGCQVIPGKFERTLKGEIRLASCLKEQQTFLIEIDKNVSETSLEEVVESTPFIQQNAFALTESVRSRYKDPDDPTCNGELRYRSWFIFPNPTDQQAEMKWAKDRLLQEFPNADTSGSTFTNGAYGIQGARHIILNQCISQNVCVEWGREWKEHLLTPKRQNPVSIERLKELPSEYLNAIKHLNYRGNGWSSERLPCLFTAHEHDGWNSTQNAMVVAHDKGRFTFYCHKCEQHKTFSNKCDSYPPKIHKTIPKRRINHKIGRAY